MDIQKICRQCERRKVPKDKITKARKEIREKEQPPSFLEKGGNTSWFYDHPFKARYQKLPGVFRNAWKEVFGDLKGGEVLLFVEKMQDLFMESEKGIRKRHIEELRRSVVYELAEEKYQPVRVL